jgi:DNA-binding XRE family transcriptional regulator
MAILKRNNLAEFRYEAAITQRELSELSGVPIRTIQDQEAGIFCSPNLKTARKLVKALSKSLKRKLTVDGVWPE